MHCSLFIFCRNANFCRNAKILSIEISKKMNKADEFPYPLCSVTGDCNRILFYNFQEPEINLGGNGGYPIAETA